MKYINTPLLFILVMVSQLSLAQVGGNQVYQTNQRPSRNYALHQAINNQTIKTTESDLTIEASVLLNKKADYYLLTLGTKAYNKTVIQCNQNLNRRITAFKKDLSRKGIKKHDVYVDFISQIKVYDHKIERNHIIEFFDGFEIRKNIIIKLQKLDLVDKIIELASKQNFFDVVKLDYHNREVDKIYDQLFEDAVAIIGKKKRRFLKNSRIGLKENYRILSVNLAKYLPKNMYSGYNEAFESSTVNTTYYSGNYVKKAVRKEKTFYYEGIENTLVADKVIDNISPVVGIQYVMTVKVRFGLSR